MLQKGNTYRHVRETKRRNMFGLHFYVVLYLIVLCVYAMHPLLSSDLAGQKREREVCVCAVHSWKDNITLHHCYVIWSFGYHTNIVLLDVLLRDCFLPCDSLFLLFFIHTSMHIFMCRSFFSIFSWEYNEQETAWCVGWSHRYSLSIWIMWCATIATIK